MRPHWLTLSAFFVLSTLGFLAALGQIPFTLPGVTVPTGLVALSTITAAAVSLAIIAALRDTLPLAAACRLPYALLLFPVLRGKAPDLAYDSFMYKTTLPYQLAEWRTGDTALIDGYMVGTNLQEMLNALLIVITRDYLPPFISTVSFVLLAFIIPLAFPLARLPSPAARLALAFAGLSAFVLTEAGIAQGTAYQEPLLLLFLVAALIRCPAWPAFLAIAIAIKINAAFIAPLIVLHHAISYRAFWLSPRRLLIGTLAAAVVLAPQINRNVIFSGRVLGLNETLAAITDPPGPRQVMTTGATRYDVKVRGGVLNNAIQSACNMWLLDDLCPVRYDNATEAGFNVFPASRAPLFAILFSVAVLLGARLSRSRRLIGLASVTVFAVCYAGFLAFLSEDRYFLPLSLGFSILLLINHEQAGQAIRAVAPWLGVALGCWLIGSNLIPGTFTNASWICARDLLTTAIVTDLRQPQTPLQTFLAAYVERYKQVCPPPGLPPVILAENDKLNSPYLGAQRIFHVFTQPMIARFFAADPARQTAAATAIIAVVAETPGYPAAMLNQARDDFTPCFDQGLLHVLCSRRLAPAAPHCATSLYRP